MGSTTFTVTLLAAMVGTSPIDNLACEYVDLIEINHFHDEWGRPVFDQLIFYDWSESQGRYQVRAFRMLKVPMQMPRRNWQVGGYDAIWHDGQNGDLLRRVRATCLKETWTQHDPELLEREFLPKERRKELTKASPSPSGSITRARRENSAPDSVASRKLSPHSR